MDTAAKTQATQSKEKDVRPTIALDRVLLSIAQPGSFSGWGPKVSSINNTLRNWN